ncbi:MAG: MBL fold metallo-hydrolase [Chthoniobacterales bacterium]
MTADARAPVSGMSVRFWGVRGSLPSPGPETIQYGGNTSCVEIRCGDELLICDAGSGIRALGAELISSHRQARITATLLVSHTHWDHIQGLPFFKPAYSANHRIRVLGAAGHATKLRTGFNNQMEPIHFPVALDQLRGLTGIEELEPHGAQFGCFAVDTIELRHPGGCAGFRISAAGSTVCYLPDHEPYTAAALRDDSAKASEFAAAQNQLVEFVRGADLLILDTQFDDHQYNERVGWGHGSVRESVGLALAAGVRTLALFHHDPEHDDAKLEAMATGARRCVSLAGGILEIRIARERERLLLSNRRALAA